MASSHFKKLDEESRALVERWDEIARVIAIVAVVAVAVWALCAALRAAVHATGEQLVELATQGWPGAAALLGALLAGALVRTLLYRMPLWREAAGDGMQRAIENYQITYVHDGDDPEPRYRLPAFGAALRKAIATYVTLGSGASGGLEAPSVVIGEGLSTGIARVLRIRSEVELRTYQLAGIAAAVATLLGAPFTAALFAAEVAYGDRIIYRKLAYGLWAGVVATWCDTWLHGTYAPMFHPPAHEPLYSVAEYSGAALVAIFVSVPLAFGFGRAIVLLRRLVERAGPEWLGSASVVLVGVLALSLHAGLGIAPHHVLGGGHETIDALLGHSSELDALHVLILVLVAKLLATGLTITTGGSAGMLVPSMVLGGLGGAITAQAINASGLATIDPALFAVVGISTALVAVVGVPLAAIALVFEVFGRVFGPPAILACGLTYLLTLKFKVYEARAAEGTASVTQADHEGVAAEGVRPDPAIEPAIAPPPPTEGQTPS
ncbi:MAG: chloride channel protein [Deltaproteobacteria bacterium]|nr:chloride channel protein [Deltaproteobacteria bacterium]